MNATDRSFSACPVAKFFVVSAVVCAALCANAATYYWKPGATQGDWDLLSNWSTVSVDGDDATNLPSGNDDLAAGLSYNFNLKGGTYSLRKLYDETGNTTSMEIANGSLTFNTELRATKCSFAINSGATLLIPANSTLYTGVYSWNDAMPFNVNNGGTLEVRGTLRLWRTDYNIGNGGICVLAPSKIRFTNTYQNTINNNGTLTIPNGLSVGSSDSDSNGKLNLNQNGGVMNLGGTIALNNYNGTFNVDFAGGTVNVTGNASFDVTSAQVSGPVTFNVAEGKILNTTSLVIGSGGSLMKTGPGYIAFPATAQTVTVSEGGVALESGTYDLSAVTFAANTTVHLATFGGTINQGCYPASLTANATFTADLSAATAGTTIFNSDDATLLGKIRSDLSSSVPQNLELTVSGTQLMLETATSAGNTFTVTGNITAGTGWGGSVPDAGANVAISGEGVVGTLPSGASFPAWASIEVKDGATLRIEANATLLPITLNKNARLEIGNNATVALANTGDLAGVVNVLGDVVTIPVLSIESGATLNVPGGMKFSNVNISLAGTIAVTVEGGVTFGYSAAGETTYIGLSVNGGEVSLTHSSGSYDASPLEFCCPADGGSVVAVGTLSFVNATIKPWSRTSYPFTEEYRYGFHMGINNPEAKVFTVLFDNTSWGVSGKTIITGGAVFRLQNGAKYQNAENLSLWGRTAEISKAAKVVVGNGGEFRLNAMGDYGNQPLKVNPTSTGHQAVVLEEGGVFESYRTAGNSKGVFTVTGDSDYCIFMPSNYHIGSSSTYDTTNAPFAGLASVAISEGKTLSLTTRNKLWSDGKFGDESGDRVVALADVPITGGGSIALSNDNVNVFGVIVRSGDNTATGTASVLPPAAGKGATTLFFADGANWAGTVVAGNVLLTNLTAGASASTATFGVLDLADDFHVRVWMENGSIVTNDMLNVGTYENANGGRLVPISAASGEPLAADGKIIVGKISKSSSLPTVARGWSARTSDILGDDANYLLTLKPNSGLQIVIR